MFVLSSVSFLKNLIHFLVTNVVQATSSHKGEKVRSYIISFKLEVVDFAEKKSISAAALKCKLDDWHSIRDWKQKKKKKNELQELSISVSNKNRKRLQGGGMKILSGEIDDQLLE